MGRCTQQNHPYAEKQADSLICWLAAAESMFLNMFGSLFAHIQIHVKNTDFFENKETDE